MRAKIDHLSIFCQNDVICTKAFIYYTPIGKPLPYMKGLYVRLKDEVFKGSRPYPAEFFETMLKKELGETIVMTDIKEPK